MNPPPPADHSQNDKTLVDMTPVWLASAPEKNKAAPVPGPGLPLSPTVYLCIETPKNRKHFAIDKVPLRIGRAKDCDVMLPYPGISRWHAEVNLDALGRLVLNDLGSVNGTSVNNRLIDGPHVLQADDRILIQPITLHVRTAVLGTTSAYDGTESSSNTSVIPSQAGASRGLPLQPDELAFLTRLHHELIFCADDPLGRAELACAALLNPPFLSLGATLLEHPLKGEANAQVLRYAGTIRPHLSPLLASRLNASPQPTVTSLAATPAPGPGASGVHALKYPLSGSQSLAAAVPSPTFTRRKQLLFGVVGALLDQFSVHHPESPHRLFHFLPPWAKCASAIGAYPVRGAHATLGLLADNQYLHFLALACDGIPPEQAALLPAVLAAEILLGKNFTDAESLHAFCAQVVGDQYPNAKLRGLAVASVPPAGDRDGDLVHVMVSGMAHVLVATDGKLDAARFCAADDAAMMMDIGDLLILRAGQADTLPKTIATSPKMAAHAWASHGIALTCEWLPH